jgi:hypothetical protein
MAIDLGGLLSAVRLVTEEFRVWRKRHRLGRPIEIRDRLDELVRIGESLRSKWLNKKRPRWRTQRWIVTTRTFVKRHFSVSQYDEFNIEAVGSNEEGAEMRVAIILKLQTSDPKGYALAMQVEKMVEGLKRIRKEIRD